MDNYKKQILQRVIDFYIEKSDADKKTIRTVACLMNDIEAINYTRCCKELKDKEKLTFDEWTKQQGYKQDFFYFKKDKEYLKPTEVFQKYNTYKQNL